jgi:hypothetical protein
MSYNGAANLKNGSGPNMTKERVKEDWEKWFAWHPVEVNGKRVWMQTVYRRYCFTRMFGERFNETYEYGDLFTVLKN